MNRWILVLFSALLVVSSSVSLAEVIVLNDSNFERLTQASTGQTTGKWFVKFYASWCGHCKTLAPKWEELSNSFGDDDVENNSGIVVAKVDGVANRETVKRFQVKGYPTLIYIADGKFYRYKGVRKVEDMKEFCIKGYKLEEGFSVPPPPTIVETGRKKVKEFVESQKLLSMLLEDFEHIVNIRKNAAVVLLLMGALVGFLVGYFVGCSGKRKLKTD